MASSNEARNGLGTGLPDLPTGLKDEDFRLVSPLYLAVNSLAGKISRALGLTSYPLSSFASLQPKDTIQSGRLNVLYAQATETLAYGDPVNFHIVGTTLSVRKADAVSNAKPCHGICSQVAGIDVGDYGQSMLGPGLFPAAVTGTATYYLGVGGGITATRPTGVGRIVQALGFGLDSGGFYFNPSSYFQQL